MTRNDYSDFFDRLRRELGGEAEVMTDAASRGRYATDASIYQIMPLGVVVPRTPEAARAAFDIAAASGVPILPRGAGSSQCGQATGAAMVIDNTRHLNRVVDFDAAARRVVVEPGIVLDRLNAFLRPHKLWFAVDVSTAAQCTLGGMAGNNSCGSRSIAYGNMVDNVLAIEARLAGGELAATTQRFGAVPEDIGALSGDPHYLDLCRKSRALWEREKDEIAARFPQVQRRVAGYNLDRLAPDRHNMAQLLVGSEGTLAYFERLHLVLQDIPPAKALGVAHFPRFRDAMAAAQHIVKLGPTAVELVDRTMIDLARSRDAFRATVRQFIRGEPDAILLVEFAGENAAEQARGVERLDELMGDLGFPGAVVKIADPGLQREVWEVRKAGLNIMMSMKGEGKPVSFIEDCAVPLEHLAEYTARLTEVFEKHGTRGTWYAHASVGCLHVRPVLNMKEDGAQKMRAIAEEAAAMVRQYKGAYSGEHGDGLVRSEWIAPFFGPRLTAALGEIKSWFDPAGVMNPGKIVDPPRMDDRTLFRYPPGYRTEAVGTALDWTPWETDGSRGHGFAAAVEMCNNNGHCRKFDAGTMCLSYRATGDERHLTRGRANTLRLALSGQLSDPLSGQAGGAGESGLCSEAVRDALDLCVSCKGCKRECPTGVDMARMKIEVRHQQARRHGVRLRERLVAWLPRYAPLVAKLPWLFKLRDAVPGLARLSEKVLGLSARRPLPRWRRDVFTPPAEAQGPENGREVLLWADTFDTYHDPDNARAALRVLVAAGYRVHVAQPVDGGRALCCGRTFLAAGLVDEARYEASRLVAAVRPFIARGVPLVGLEPSCLLGLRDELPAMLPDDGSRAVAGAALLFEEFLAREIDAGRLDLKLKPLAEKRALLHGHCHQKAFGAMSAVEKALRLIPGLEVKTVESGCCGMAGAFGYEAEHYDISMKMGEAALLPAVRAADADTLIVADGTSCRQQIADGAKRQGLHVARVLERALV